MYNLVNYGYVHHRIWLSPSYPQDRAAKGGIAAPVVGVWGTAIASKPK